MSHLGPRERGGQSCLTDGGAGEWVGIDRASETGRWWRPGLSYWGTYCCCGEPGNFGTGKRANGRRLPDP